MYEENLNVEKMKKGLRPLGQLTTFWASPFGRYWGILLNVFSEQRKSPASLSKPNQPVAVPKCNISRRENGSPNRWQMTQPPLLLARCQRRARSAGHEQEQRGSHLGPAVERDLLCVGGQVRRDRAVAVWHVRGDTLSKKQVDEGRGIMHEDTLSPGYPPARGREVWAQVLVMRWTLSKLIVDLGR